MERPYRRCTRRPWAFCATSVMASEAPPTKRAIAKRTPVGDNAADSRPRLVSTVPMTAMRADPKRRISVAARSPAAIAPAGKAASARP